MPQKDHFSILGLGFGGATEPEKLCFFGHEKIFFAKITKIIDFGMILGARWCQRGILNLSSNWAHSVGDGMKKSMENDQKVMKNEEKVFFYVKTPQQPYKVIGSRVGHHTRRKVTKTFFLKTFSFV